MSVSGRKEFHDERAAHNFLEAPVWPGGPVYPCCGSMIGVNKLKSQSTRISVYKCYECRKPFMEGSKVPMHPWLQAMHLMRASKKGIRG